jgi:hypothetical protein
MGRFLNVLEETEASEKEAVDGGDEDVVFGIPSRGRLSAGFPRGMLWMVDTHAWLDYPFHFLRPIWLDGSGIVFGGRGQLGGHSRGRASLPQALLATTKPARGRSVG